MHYFKPKIQSTYPKDKLACFLISLSVTKYGGGGCFPLSDRLHIPELHRKLTEGKSELMICSSKAQIKWE